MTTETQNKIDDYVNKIKSKGDALYDTGTYVLSILSDAQETSDPIQRNEWINQAKYVVAKHLGGK